MTYLYASSLQFQNFNINSVLKMEILNKLFKIAIKKLKQNANFIQENKFRRKVQVLNFEIKKQKLPKSETKTLTSIQQNLSTPFQKFPHLDDQTENPNGITRETHNLNGKKIDQKKVKSKREEIRLERSHSPYTRRDRWTDRDPLSCRQQLILRIRSLSLSKNGFLLFLSL